MKAAIKIPEILHKLQIRDYEWGDYTQNEVDYCYKCLKEYTEQYCEEKTREAYNQGYNNGLRTSKTIFSRPNPKDVNPYDSKARKRIRPNQ